MPNIAIRILSTWVMLTALGFSAAGCSRPAGDRSKLRLNLPDAPKFSSKGTVDALANPDFVFCYYVNVTAPDIATNGGGTCGKPQGLTSGFLTPRSLIEMDVPRGTDRTVELFGYIAKDAAGETCAALSGKLLTDMDMNRVFRLANPVKTDTNTDYTEVRIKRNPVNHIRNHLGIQDNFPSTCYADLPDIPDRFFSNPNGMRTIVDARATQSDEGVKLFGQISGGLPRAQLTSKEGVKLLVR